MPYRRIPVGVIHSIPADVCNALHFDEVAIRLWNDITTLARNEWICCIEETKKSRTRITRIERLRTALKEGKRRPFCGPVALTVPRVKGVNCEDNDL